jgi:hypothetical protein
MEFLGQAIITPIYAREAACLNIADLCNAPKLAATYFLHESEKLAWHQAGLDSLTLLLEADQSRQLRRIAAVAKLLAMVLTAKSTDAEYG